MNFSNIDYHRSSCSTRNEEIPMVDPEVKAPGIFEQMRETDEVLTEIMQMLDLFKREVRSYDIPVDECKPIEPTCFKDAVSIVNSKAYAIKGDLARIIGKFR